VKSDSWNRPVLVQAPVIVVFLDAERIGEVFAPHVEQMEVTDWGDPMDEDGARLLVALHEELAPYRTEVIQVYDPDTED
jgi:hypothetical protein